MICTKQIEPLSFITRDTLRQLKWSEDHNKTIGIRKDYRSSVSNNIYNIKLKVKGNENYWKELCETTLKQTEFNSVGLGFMHFMSPELNYKNNPYKVMKIWVDIGEEKKAQMYGIQQVYKDRISCKIIGTYEQIEKVNQQKKYEENDFWEDELVKIREYSGNDLHRSKEEIKRMANNMGGIEFVQVTTMDDYDFEYSIYNTWHNYKKALKNSNRVEYLETQLEKIESKTLLMEDWEIKLYKILAREYGVMAFDIDERHLLAEASQDIAKEFDTHPAEIWKAFWVYIEDYVRKEIEWLENNL